MKFLRRAKVLTSCSHPWIVWSQLQSWIVLSGNASASLDSSQVAWSIGLCESIERSIEVTWISKQKLHTHLSVTNCRASASRLANCFSDNGFFSALCLANDCLIISFSFSLRSNFSRTLLSSADILSNSILVDSAASWCLVRWRCAFSSSFAKRPASSSVASRCCKDWMDGSDGSEEEVGNTYL